MKNYIVKYSLGGHVYETVVRSASSDAAILWIETLFPTAIVQKILGEDE